MDASLCHRLLTAYDACLAEETELVWQVYYHASRGKFEAITLALGREPLGSVLEIGTSDFASLLKAVCPEVRVVTLNLVADQPRWGDVQGLEYVISDVLYPPAPLPDQSFDVVVFSEVIEHLQGNPRIACSELYRLLRPGGCMILTTPNLARLANRARLLAGVTPLEAIGPPGWGGHIREYTRVEIVDFLQQAGFCVEIAEHAMYWDTLDCYLRSGHRGNHADGRFFYRPRYRGWRRVLATPLLALQSALVRRVPSLRYGMLFVARRPLTG